MKSAMSQQPSGDLAALLAPIRARFFDGLELRIIRLETASVKLAGTPSDVEALQVVRHECHKMAGVAPTLGFERAGALARSIDEALSTNSTFAPKTAQTLEHLLNELEALLDMSGAAAAHET